ncbi:hypothetical protein AX15_004612 [Amanita polypyramis BW_CC]|nr:hypothetical protein AX15_004612 [Amanita polypyramis BW_CC]
MPTHSPHSWLRALPAPFATRKSPPAEYQFLSTNSSSNTSHNDFDSDGYNDECDPEQQQAHAYRYQNQRHFHQPYFHHKRRTHQCVPHSCSLLSLVRACLHHLTLRKLLYALFVTPFLLALGVLLSGVPPNYRNIRTYERLLPQHNSTRARIEGGQYLRFPGHLWGHGLNNVMQEAILMSYLSYLTNRSFVFEDYVWSQTPFPYTIYDFALRPARMPFNAFISGPTAGGPMSPPPSSPHSKSDLGTHRLAVSAEFYTSICPPSQRHVVPVDGAPLYADGAAYIQWWVDRLSSVQNYSCVEIDSGGKQVFDWALFGEKRLLTLWDGLSHSPILENFSWSHLVLSAVLRNWAVLRPFSKRAFYDSLSQPPTHPPVPATLTLGEARRTKDKDGYAQPGLPGVVAIHIRRGDYGRHCQRLADGKGQFLGFNQFPSFVDVFDPERGYLHQNRRQDHGHNDQNQNEDEPDDVKSYHLSHCFPDIPQIVSRLAQVKRDNPGLMRVYVLSNGWEWWLAKLKRELTKLPVMSQSSSESGIPVRDRSGESNAEETWQDVITSYDLALDSEQRYVGMAVDMAIAERAEVFVGNGFSSLTSNIVMLRMAKGMDPTTNRFL